MRRRHDTIYAVAMVLLIMSLALYAAGPAAGLLVGSAVAGLAVAVLRIRKKSG